MVRKTTTRTSDTTPDGAAPKAKKAKPVPKTTADPGDAETTAPPVTAIDIPAIRDPAQRAPVLVDVGLRVDETVKEQAAFALASDRRRASGSLLAEFAHATLSYADMSQAQIFQDVFALFFNGTKRGGYFVEVGAGDGKLISNTYLLEKTFGWSGLVVEASPAFLPALQRHRDCRIATDCVLGVSGRQVTFRCTAEPEFSAISDSSDDLHQPRRAEDYTEIHLTTISLNDLLQREGCPTTIDYLSLDIEGVEFEVLQTFDFTRTRINCLTVEHNWTDERAQIHELLTGVGFVRVFEHFSQWDDWYVHRDLLGAIPAAQTMVGTGSAGPAPERAHAFLRSAIEAVARGDLDVAQALCLHAVGIDPRFSAAFRTLAEIAMQLGQDDVALGHWHAAVAADPTDYWAHIGLAEVLATRGERGEAIAVLQFATTLKENSSEARVLLDLWTAKN
ncbi:FkbM family methyltransferase [Sphingomonas arantia]|uniref:FkbM family methyltransferase n=1 Tax=Sphingomonas arantia TaxID=1460676 RepID=A0ABW4TYH4_9SPHN